MNQIEFSRLVKLYGLRGKSVEACRRVLVVGETAYAVAQDMGLAKSTISRALARLRRPRCECCGQPLPSNFRKCFAKSARIPSH